MNETNVETEMFDPSDINWQAVASATMDAINIVLHEEVKAGNISHERAHVLLDTVGSYVMDILRGRSVIGHTTAADFDKELAEEQADTVVIGD